MVLPQVVDYLRAHLPTFDAEDLRLQLREEGISEQDFQDSLAVARSNPKAPPAPTVRLKAPPDRKKAMILAAALGSVLLLVLAAMMMMKPATEKPAAAASSGESGYVGHAGWVVRLPPNYVGVSAYRDAEKTDEVVHFCPRGTDPTNFIDKELFGQMGIVRLEAAPSEFPPNPAGLARLSQAVARKLRNTKFTTKNIQIATLPGVQANILSPTPHIETYVLGQNELYFFYGGQEDEIWRAIVLSLRDAHSEN